ncbi:MAG: MFS transporter [Bdellovibrionales bacterium]|nr:MFS transporter [Ramlibacter sp.]
MSHPQRAATAMLAGQVLCMLGMASYTVLLPTLQREWALSNAGSGLIGSGFFLGYICTVTFWSTLTDRMDARRIYMTGCAIACLGLALFGLLAQGLWTALLAHMVYGVGVSATYMPGLKILSDRYQGTRQSRVFSFYTAFYGLGGAISLAATQALADAFGWREAFVVAATGPVLAMGLVVWLTRPLALPVALAHRPTWRDAFPLQAWLVVLRHQRSRPIIIGYTVHCLEMFGARGWSVAFLVFAAGAGVGAGMGGDMSAGAAQAGASRLPLAAGTIAAWASLFSVGASILGNEAALRLGRERWIRLSMLASSLLGVAMAACAASAWPLLLALVVFYQLAVMSDSATLTAGLVEASEPGRRGAALGLYSLMGFAGGMLGPAVFGIALDATGGGLTTWSWVAGYAVLGLGCLAFSLQQFYSAASSQQQRLRR